MRLWVFCIICVSLNSQSRAEEIKIGVRPDTKPFSYCKDSSCTASLDGYDGYSIAVCKNILDDMRVRNPGMGVSVVKVTAADRLLALDNNQVDFLCGADTITEERLDKYAFSFPIYVTGISIASRRQDSENRGCEPGAKRPAVVGMVGNTTAQSDGIDLMLQAGEFGQFEKVVRQAKDNSLEGKAKCADGISGGPDVEIVKTYSDHETGLRAFCNGDVKYYIADREILLFARQCDDIMLSDRTYSYDEYGLVFRKPSIDAPRDYWLFSEISYSLQKLAWGTRSILLQSVLSKMNNYRLSPDLEQFFRSVTGGAVPNHP
ncbi:transporter substrate-binding domain-containing protein [Mesorhizobium calcicola]|uniref:Transporter substrate-binding domain-containing protein n=1 Tax=Mesorhizobium calcicola TaxID=1300310 RepID=A0ABW4WFF4_9HYPH